MNTPTYQDLCSTATNHLNQGEIEKSIQSAHEACRSFPKYTQAYCIIGKALTLKGDYLSALETYELSWLIDPLNQDALTGVAEILSRLRNEPIPINIDRPIPELASFGYYSKACRRFLKIKMLEAAERAVELSANEKSDLLLQTAIMDIDASLCKWEKFQDHMLYFSRYIDPTQHLPSVSPWLSLCIQDNPRLHLRVAQKFFGDTSGHKAVITRKIRPLGKLKSRARIAYLSADFHDHATSRLIAGMLEAHSKEDWEVIGLSYGPDDQSEMRTRVKNSFENFIDLRKLSTQSAIENIKSLNLDILIDTKGLTADFESLYTLSRPAPVIVNFLAYPGSMGSSAYDYVIGDKTITPFDHQEFYTECLVQMPNSYQPNDSYAPINEQTNRLTEGLPEKSFIFAAFNNTKKITPQHFKVWMNILKNTPQSILWLYCEEETAKKNLQKNAADLGISPSRLFFASHKTLPAHLARHQLADLFLDTYPCNAHTTASDALRMGLPLLTLQGNSFASRVAGSLLKAVNINELITHSEAEYESMAIKLYENQALLKNLKNKLLESLNKSSLYNPALYSKNLEQAYAFMIDRSRKGKPPHAFEVRCISEGGGVRLKGGRDFKPVQLYR